MSFTHYPARARKAEITKSRLKGTPFVSVMFEVTEGPPAARAQWFEWQGFLTTATVGRTARQLRLAGCALPGGDVTDMTGLGSLEVSIAVEQTDRGPRVAFVNPLRVQLADDDRAKLAMELSGAVLESENEPADDDLPI